MGRIGLGSPDKINIRRNTNLATIQKHIIKQMEVILRSPPPCRSRCCIINRFGLTSIRKHENKSSPSPYFIDNQSIR
ncbi:hypothetical protein AAMO2058_000815400, partial [Amorphochlora amoebiformis]